MKEQKQSKVDLEEIFQSIQEEIANELVTNRRHIDHPSAKGEATEFKWIETLRGYLPNRYSVDKGFIIDSKGNISHEIDLIVYDRQYSPFLFNRKTTLYIPCESVYAVFEIKQELNKLNLQYAGKKASSVRKLYRTSVPVVYVEGKYSCKPLHHIITGFISLSCGWKNPFGKPFISNIKKLNNDERIDLVCVLESGSSEIQYDDTGFKSISSIQKEKALIFFFLKLLSKLQSIGTCPAIEIEAYSGKIFG